jgi:hypothetical protein
MKRTIVALAFLVLCAGTSSSQKGKAEQPEYYPAGYTGNTWTGEVTAVDNDQRTLTLTYASGTKDVQTFVASIPDVPYEWARDSRKSRVLDFPYDKRATVQTFIYVGPGDVATLLPEGAPAKVQRPNPPTSNVITDFAQFMGRRITVYYTARERETNGQTVKYNDVWRIRVIPDKKK